MTVGARSAGARGLLGPLKGTGAGDELWSSPAVAPFYTEGGGGRLKLWLQGTGWKLPGNISHTTMCVVYCMSSILHTHHYRGTCLIAY